MGGKFKSKKDKKAEAAEQVKGDRLLIYWRIEAKINRIVSLGKQKTYPFIQLNRVKRSLHSK